jgi:hypothetical protein
MFPAEAVCFLQRQFGLQIVVYKNIFRSYRTDSWLCIYIGTIKEAKALPDTSGRRIQED